MTRRPIRREGIRFCSAMRHSVALDTGKIGTGRRACKIQAGCQCCHGFQFQSSFAALPEIIRPFHAADERLHLTEVIGDPHIRQGDFIGEASLSRHLWAEAESRGIDLLSDHCQRPVRRRRQIFFPPQVMDEALNVLGPKGYAEHLMSRFR